MLYLNHIYWACCHLLYLIQKLQYSFNFTVLLIEGGGGRHVGLPYKIHPQLSTFTILQFYNFTHKPNHHGHVLETGLNHPSFVQINSCFSNCNTCKTSLNNWLMFDEICSISGMNS